MTTTQALISIGVMALGTFATRVLPFILFPSTKKTPSFILYLGKVLPYALIGMLIIYCLKDVSISESPHGLPELIAIIVVGILYQWKRNSLVAIGVGTLLYMALVQFIFL